MLETRKVQFWFAVGSQHLYGPEALEQVAANAREIVAEPERGGALGYELVLKPLLTTPEDIRRFMIEANADDRAPASSRGCTRSRRRRCGSAGCRC